jgi:hypothetical protein
VNDASYIALQLEALSYAETSNDLGIALDGSVPFSLDAWVSLDGLCASAALLSKDGVISFGLSGNALVLAIAGYPPVQSDPSKAPLTEAEWHHVCATYANGMVRLYIDGAFNVVQGISGSGRSSASPFRIGEDLQAQLSCVRVYREALTAEAVKANMFRDPAPASIAAWFDFTQAPPVDRGARKLPITLSSGAEMLELTPALELGSTAYAEPHNDEHVNPGGGQVDAYTVQAWVHVEGRYPPEQAIFSNGDLDGGSGMALLLEAAGSGFSVVSQRGPSTGGESLTATTGIVRGKWANVATTFDGTRLTLYVDGVLAGSKVCGPIPVGRLTGRPLIGAASRQGQPAGTTTLQGYISRVEVWRKALSAAEVTQYMAAPPAVDGPALEASYDFTTSPARNRHDRDPVGLFDGANLTTEVSQARAGRPLPALAAQQPPPDAMEDEVLRELVEGLDFSDFLRDHEGDLLAAAAADEGAFAGSPEAQQIVRDAWQETIEKLRTNPRSLPFLLTSHTVGEDYVLLCHSPQGSYVAMRTPLADLEPCLQWKVELVFCIVAGVLSALFGLSATLSQRASDFIARVLRHPQIVALMARGARMSAATIFSLACALWWLGFLKTLVTLVVELGFWALLRLFAKFLAKLVPGLGAADLIASLVATAVSFIYIYTQRRPPGCAELPSVDLASIRFNYDPSGAATDALAIRRNYSKHVPIAEWVKGETNPEQSPAAYAIAQIKGKTVTIQAKLLISDPTVTQAQIKAEGGGVLGAIDPVTVKFKNGESDPDFVTLNLPHHTLPAGGVNRTDITWSWFYKTSGDWQPITTTAHRIYVLLDVPTGPWKQSATPSADTQVPWTEVLDLACTWAQGATTAEAAAAAVTRRVYGNLGLKYDRKSGASAYTVAQAPIGWVFQCGEFLSFLAGKVGKGATVNCTDCATIVTTFANAVGCNLFASQMSGPAGRRDSFMLNKMVAIGYSVWNYPFDPPNGPEFSYHEVAWTGTASYGDPLYDACLQVDAGTNPWDWTNPSVVHTPQLPVAMTFSGFGAAVKTPIPVPFTASSYRERLATNNPAGIEHCLPKGPETYTASGRRSLV